MSNKWKNISFDRWTPQMEHSWPYRVFGQYEDELMRLIISYESAESFAYGRLKNEGAKWESAAKDFGLRRSDNTQTIRQWSDNYNKLGNWFRLGLLLSLNSYFETYLSAIIKECIDSDPGLLFGLSHEIDGVLMLKGQQKIKKDEIANKIKNCTKGTWSQRVANMTNLFGPLPQFSGHVVSRLDKLRIIRNKVGHAFGRDISKAQKYNEVTSQEMQKLSIESFNKYHIMITHLVQDLDTYLMSHHIGNYEPLFHYHMICTQFGTLNKGEKMVRLKKSLGRDKNVFYSKDFCRGVVMHYEQL